MSISIRSPAETGGGPRYGEGARAVLVFLVRAAASVCLAFWCTTAFGQSISPEAEPPADPSLETARVLVDLRSEDPEIRGKTLQDLRGRPEEARRLMDVVKDLLSDESEFTVATMMPGELPRGG